MAKKADKADKKADKKPDVFKADRQASKAVEKAKDQGSGQTVGKDGKASKSVDPLKQARTDKRKATKAVAKTPLKGSTDKQKVKIDAAREKIVDRRIETLQGSPGWNPSDPRRQELQKLTARKARIDARQARRRTVPGGGTTPPAETTPPEQTDEDRQLEADIAKAKSDLDFYFKNAFPNDEQRKGLVDLVTGAIRNRTLFVDDSQNFTDRVWALVETTETYKQRFPGLVSRTANGHARMTPDDYMTMENLYDDALRDKQIPGNVLDRTSTIAKLVENDVTVEEMQQRIDWATDAATRSPSFMKKFLEYRGMTPGYLIAFYLDPDQTAEKITQQQRVFEIGAMMDDLGMRGQKSSAEFLEGIGMSDASVGQTLERAASQAAFSSGFGGRVDEQTRVKGAAGAAAEADAVDKVAAQRKARFNSTGGAAESREGVVGLGSASR